MKKVKQPQITIEEISATREIAEIQLERLKAISRERLLTYEETKILDLLHKNLLLDRGDATNTITVDSKHVEQLTDEKLMEIAMTVDKDLINRSLNTVDQDDKNTENTSN